MSTCYITTIPCTIKKAIQLTGWKRTDNPNYLQSPDSDDCIEIYDSGDGRLCATQYGANQVDDFVEKLDMVSEHDAGYYSLTEGKFPGEIED